MYFLICVPCKKLQLSRFTYPPHCLLSVSKHGHPRVKSEWAEIAVWGQVFSAVCMVTEGPWLTEPPSFATLTVTVMLKLLSKNSSRHCKWLEKVLPSVWLLKIIIKTTYVSHTLIILLSFQSPARLEGRQRYRSRCLSETLFLLLFPFMHSSSHSFKKKLLIDFSW